MALRVPSHRCHQATQERSLTLQGHRLEEIPPEVEYAGKLPKDAIPSTCGDSLPFLAYLRPLPGLAVNCAPG